MVAKKSRRTNSKKSRSTKSGGSKDWLTKIAKHKNLILLGVAFYAVVFVVINYIFFVKSEVRKEITVQTVGQFSGLGKRCGVFGPADITAVGTDKLAVTDKDIRRILLFSREGDFIKIIGEAKSKNPQDMVGFAGISSDEKGNLYVVDDGINSISVYDIKGENVQNVSLQAMNCYVPRYVCWNGTYFLLADTGGQKIIKISGSGEMLDKWGVPGNSKDCFNNPYKVVLDPLGNGNFYVSDFDNMRVKYMGPTGKVIKIIKCSARPNAIAVDSQGNLYIASAEGGFVKVYGPSAGSYKGDLKDSKGLDMFTGVRGLDFAPDGTLLLAENEGISEVKIPIAGQAAPKNP